MNKLIVSISVVLTLLTSGCSGVRITDSKGTEHHFIIGIGIVSIPQKNEVESVQVTKSNVLGLHVSDQAGLKIGAGYAASNALVIPSHIDTTVEIDENPMGAIVIKTKNYK